jgi:hypothetical protein
VIKARQSVCTVTDDVFATAIDVITKARVAEALEFYYREATRGGGRPPAGIQYTALAIWVALLVRFLQGRPHSLRGVMDTIGEFSDQQLAAVGMIGQDCSAITRTPGSEYQRMHRFWQLRLDQVDPFVDVPARRITNGEFAEILASRTQERLLAAEIADQRLTDLVNDLLYGSINDPAPPDCEGDVVVDETIINTASPDRKIGIHPQRCRAASAVAGYWIRDKSGVATASGHTKEIRGSGYGIGATFFSRVARRHTLHAQPPMFISMDVHRPTGANLTALQTCIAQIRRTGLDCRQGGRSRWPLLTADMGYNSKAGFGELMITTKYSPVVRYPKGWGVKFTSAPPPGAPPGPPPGPVQYAGAFFCPAALKLLDGHRTPDSEEILNNDGFKVHDQRLRAIYPFLMGFHTRPYFGDNRYGRPRLGVPAQQVSKIRLVCPAALGAVMCPLKPESLDTDNIGLPLAEPEWTADAMACCAKSSVTVSLTEDQLRMAQWDLVPGSWEHTLYYEAARSLTEQRFSQLKSRHVAGLDKLTTGPRRTPMIKIAVALAAATVNIRAQQGHRPGAARTESIDVRTRQLSTHLGYPPARIPPRS